MKTLRTALTLTFTASLALLASSSVSAQTAYKAPRNAFGQPDLQGVWTNASLTNLERPPNFTGLTISEAQAKQLEEGRARSRVAGDAPTDPNAPPPRSGSDPGGYNTGWTDPGTTMGRLRGEVRTSWIVEPANGRLPYSPEGRRTFDAKLAFARQTFDGPEARPNGERCIVGFGSTGGPPMLNVLYNNHYQFVQTKDHVAIVVEMNHDARIVRLNSTHLPSHIRPWLGDSIGWYEGDTLVVETTNFNPGDALRPNMQSSFYMSEDAKVTERFTRVSKDQILYQFTVDDPKIFTQTWKGEMPINATNDRMYEYACHEGNHALEGILAGARQDERAGRVTVAVDVSE
jgi:hypothetical protein